MYLGPEYPDSIGALKVSVDTKIVVGFAIANTFNFFYTKNFIINYSYYYYKIYN
jgi:hypothetical protein